MKNTSFIKAISIFKILILTTVSNQLIGQSEVQIKLNTSGESQISIQNTFGNIFLGNMSGDANAPFGILGKDNTFIGEKAGKSNTQGSSNTFIGAAAGSTTTTGGQNTFIGSYSGQYNTGSTNTFLGNQSGLFNTSGAGNIFLGYKAGQDETGSNKLYIENSNANNTGALIYGEFDNNYLRLNANVNINGAYTFPSTLGMSGQVLGINGSNQFGWMSISSLFDFDADTGIEVEALPDVDKIVMYLENDVAMTLCKGLADNLLMNIPNISIGNQAGQKSVNEEDIFIGKETGKNVEDGSSNVFIGNQAGSALINSSLNTIIGAEAGSMMSTGEGNTLLGSNTGMSSNGNSNTFIGLSSGTGVTGNNNLALGNGAGGNSNGDNNVFLGSSAGKESSSSNKLYIENTDADSTNALIYGEFDNDLLRLNAEVIINGAYALPTTGGSESNVMRLNNNGEAEWSTLNILSDNDGDTHIFLEENPDEDIIRFKLQDEEHLVLKKNAFSNTMLVPNSTWFGIDAGLNSNDGQSVFIGQSSGMNSTGSNNTFIGLGTGKDNGDGENNTFIGHNAGKTIADYQKNSFVGAFSGDEATGSFNTFNGYYAGYSMDGEYNSVMGNEAGREASGDYNVILGTDAGKSAIGTVNVFLGTGAGQSLNGENNVVLGGGAGANVSGDRNVLIGSDAGSGLIGGDKLFIENTNADSTGALIYGEFDNNKLRVNGDLGIGANAAYPMHINSANPKIKQANQSNIGAAYWAGNNTWQVRFSDANDLEYSGVYMTNTKFEPYSDNDLDLGSASYRWKEIFAVNATINTSDRRFKKNINNISYGLEEVMQMRPVSYQWKRENEGRVMNGFIAQEMEEIVPEVVHITESIVDANKPETEPEYDELYGMRYTELIPVLTKAIQEQQALIEQLTKRIEDLEKN